MDNKLVRISKTKYGYEILKRGKFSIVSKVISIILCIFIGCGLLIVNFEKLIYPIELSIKIIVCIIILFFIYYILFYNEYIKFYNDSIKFYFHLKPFKNNIIELKIMNINQISINYEIEFEEGAGEVYYYNLDLIDKDFNAYRLGQSINYDEIFNYGNKIEKILNMKLIDKNDMEGYGNIFIKRIV
jgi:hypothetical protein